MMTPRHRLFLSSLLLLPLAACTNATGGTVFLAMDSGADTPAPDATVPDGGTVTDTASDTVSPPDAPTSDAPTSDAPTSDTPSDTTCTGGSTVCGSTCVNTATDPQHCGRCEIACGGGQICRVGTCVANPCPHNQYPCDDRDGGQVCTDIATDPQHCGTCGTTCGTGMECSMGVCYTHCVSPQARCGAMCTTLATDALNCGMCGHACGMGQTCVGSACMCVAPQIACGALCVDPRTDPMNCGMCGHVVGPTQYCSGGTVHDCTAPSTLCPGNVCTSLNSDPANCATCGHACPTGNTCVAGTCICPPGSMVCSGTCVNVATDAMNCGTCAHACPSGMTCSAGACTNLVLYHHWTCPIPGCSTTSYNTMAPTNDGGMYPFNTGDTNACRAWKLAATICTTTPMMYTDIGDWSCPVSGGFTDPVFGTYCMVMNQYSCSGCPGACNAMCLYNPLSLRNCTGMEQNQM